MKLLGGGAMDPLPPYLPLMQLLMLDPLYKETVEKVDPISLRVSALEFEGSHLHKETKVLLRHG
jgi:hypothetical protein